MKRPWHPLAWITGLALVSILSIVGAWFLQRTGTRTCLRCGATVAVRAFGPIELTRESPASPGRLWFEALEGQCAPHAWRSTGCWYARGGVACTMLPDGNPLLEWCAASCDPVLARQFATRFAGLAPGDRSKAIAYFPLHPGLEGSDPARDAAFLRSYLEQMGWFELQTR